MRNSGYWTVLLMLLLVLIVAVAIGNVDDFIFESRNIYNKCADSCSKKHFEGIELGLDGEPHNFVNEFDRTSCLQSCNELYLTLKGT